MPSRGLSRALGMTRRADMPTKTTACHTDYGSCVSRPIVCFRQACVKRFERRGIVGCRHLNLWRTAHGDQAGPHAAIPAGRGPAAI
jgi:hypothetical protein